MKPDKCILRKYNEKYYNMWVKPNKACLYPSSLNFHNHLMRKRGRKLRLRGHSPRGRRWTQHLAFLLCHVVLWATEKKVDALFPTVGSTLTIGGKIIHMWRGRHSPASFPFSLPIKWERYYPLCRVLEGLLIPRVSDQLCAGHTVRTQNVVTAATADWVDSVPSSGTGTRSLPASWGSGPEQAVPPDAKVPALAGNRDGPPTSRSQQSHSLLSPPGQANSCPSLHVSLSQGPREDPGMRFSVLWIPWR